jgi:ribosomal protein L37AE/L43A
MKNNLDNLGNIIESEALNIARDKLSTDYYDVECPYCSKAFRARSGINICPHCGKKVELTLEFEF